MEYKKYETVLFLRSRIDNQLSSSAFQRALLARVVAPSSTGDVDYILMPPARRIVRVVVVSEFFLVALLLALVCVFTLDVAVSADSLDGQVETQMTEEVAPAASVNRAPSKKASKPFSLGVKQETIAWEKWHKRLVKEIMHRTEDRAVTLAKLGGIRISSLAFKTVRMQMDIVITRDKHISGRVTVPAENPKLTTAMEDAVKSLDGDDIIAFPVQSERQSIKMLFTYVRGPRVFPGMKWIKNDFETVQADH